MTSAIEMTAHGLAQGYRDGATARYVISEVLRAIDAGPPPVWISTFAPGTLAARAAALDALSSNERALLPLFGLPFAVKDNIDVGGLPTTAGCPAFARNPPRSAPAVDRLERAGAICIGKTNLDQFATGLVGVRTPYGAIPNPFNADYVCGGSSSGSAVAVALGQVAFALGTDTAGSGRIPAAFNNIVGIKPSRGLVSTRGVVPACRSLDCVSLFAADIDTAWRALDVAAGYDDADPFARRVAPRPPQARGIRLGVPESCAFAGDERARRHFDAVRAQWTAMGATFEPIDFSTFADIGSWLYEGPWVAEREAAVGAFITRHPQECHATVRAIVQEASKWSAVDAFRGEYRRREALRDLAPLWASIDALLVPSAPTIPTFEAVAAAPREANTRLGLYTNFVNLLDLAAIAVPAGFREDGLPAGFTLIAPAGGDHALALLAHRFVSRFAQTLGTSGRPAPVLAPPQPLADERTRVQVAVCGAHMRGMPLNHELLRHEARFLAATHTSPRYRLYALPGSVAKPGLVRDPDGTGIALEIWALPLERFGAFVAAVPPPMAIGSVELATGEWCKGFVCEPCALDGARDITAHRGWRAYLDYSDTLSVPTH